MFATSQNIWNICVKVFFYPCFCFIFCKTIKHDYWHNKIDKATKIIDENIINISPQQNQNQNQNTHAIAIRSISLY